MDIAKKNPAYQVSALLSPLLRAPSPFPADEQEKRGKKEKMQKENEGMSTAEECHTFNKRKSSLTVSLGHIICRTDW